MEINSDHSVIGSCQCVLESIKTRVDGSISVSISIDASNQEILSRLLTNFSFNKRLMQVAFVEVNNG